MLSFIICGAFERKDMIFWELNKLIDAHDAAIENDQVYSWSLKIKIYMIYF